MSMHHLLLNQAGTSARGSQTTSTTVDARARDCNAADARKGAQTRSRLLFVARGPGGRGVQARAAAQALAQLALLTPTNPFGPLLKTAPSEPFQHARDQSVRSAVGQASVRACQETRS